MTKKKPGKKSATGGGARGLTVQVKTARKRSNSSARWLQRQLNDPYVRRAKREGFRSRAAFKLMELDDRFHFLRPGARVIDLGAAPGGWVQIALQRIGKSGKVVGIDLLEMGDIPGATLMLGDFMDEAAPQRLRDALGGQADVVLSDMAPNASGHMATDHTRIIILAEAALEFALEILAEGGTFVAKVWQGGSEKEMLLRMKQHFAVVRHAKPPASRADSAETYVVATGFRPRAGA